MEANLAFAQQTPKSSRSSEAAALVEQGVELRRNGDDEAALEVFRKAEALDTPSSRLLVHLAAAYQALGQWEAADQYLSQALRDPNAPYIQRHRATLLEARRRIDRQISTLDVRGEPAGATVLLNGRKVGTLPLATPLRVTAGVYTLEVRHPDFYSVTRSIALAGGTVTRESLTLTASPNSDVEFFAPGASAVEADQARPDWLGWSLAALSAGSAAATIAAWQVRESHAEKWNNDSRCLAEGRSREDVCGSTLDDGEDAETLMLIGLAATSVFAGGAIYRLVWSSPSSEQSAALHEVSCGLGPMSLGCAGTF